jgi:hypothetical protein
MGRVSDSSQLPSFLRLDAMLFGYLPVHAKAVKHSEVMDRSNTSCWNPAVTNHAVFREQSGQQPQ